MVLVVVLAWGFWSETYSNKSRKSYQKKYYELELQKLGEEYDNALLAFQHPAIQKKYNEIQEKLYWARVNFKKPEVQREYRKTLKELRNLDTKELSPLKFAIHCLKYPIKRKYDREPIALIGHDGF